MKFVCSYITFSFFSCSPIPFIFRANCFAYTFLLLAQLYLLILYTFYPHPRIFSFHSFQRERKGERKGEGEISMVERSIDWLPPVCTLTRDQMRLDQGWRMPAPGLGIKPTTQVCVLTGNPAHNLSITGQHSSQLSRTGQGSTTSGNNQNFTSLTPIVS